MIINLQENNITSGNYAYVKDGAVPEHVLERACDTLPYVVVSWAYKRQKPYYYRAVAEVTNRALAVFNLYGRGDIRMTKLLKACEKHGIHLENLLCPDKQLKLSDVSKAVDQIVLDYLENKVLADIAKRLHASGEISEDVRSEAVQSVCEFAAQAATLINYTIQDRAELARPLEEVQRGFREDRLRAAVAQLNGYTSAFKELTS